MIEICLSENIKIIVKYGLGIMCEDILCFPYDLSVGNIRDFGNAANRQQYELRMGSAYFKKTEEEYYKDFVSLIGDSRNVRIWHTNSTKDRIVLKFLLYSLKAEWFTAVNVTEFDYTGKKGYVSTEKIKSLADASQPLSDEEIRDAKIIWRELVRCNSGLRVLKEGNYLSVDEDYYDNLILECVHEKCDTIGDLLYYMLFLVDVEDYFLLERIHHLIISKQLFISKDHTMFLRSQIKK